MQQYCNLWLLFVTGFKHHLSQMSMEQNYVQQPT